MCKMNKSRSSCHHQTRLCAAMCLFFVAHRRTDRQLLLPAPISAPACAPRAPRTSPCRSCQEWDQRLPNRAKCKALYDITAHPPITLNMFLSVSLKRLFDRFRTARAEPAEAASPAYPPRLWRRQRLVPISEAASSHIPHPTLLARFQTQGGYARYAAGLTISWDCV